MRIYTLYVNAQMYIYAGKVLFTLLEQANRRWAVLTSGRVLDLPRPTSWPSSVPHRSLSLLQRKKNKTVGLTQTIYKRSFTFKFDNYACMNKVCYLYILASAQAKFSRPQESRDLSCGSKYCLLILEAVNVHD